MILVKSVALFCPHSKNFPEAKLKSNGLTSLVEEMSRQLSIAATTQLLVIILIQDYNEERARGAETQQCSVERKGPLESFMVQPRLAEESRTPLTLVSLGMGQICTGIKERASSGQDPTQLSFQAVKGEDTRNFLLLERTTNKSHCKCDSRGPGTSQDQLNPKCCSQALAL